MTVFRPARESIFTILDNRSGRSEPLPDLAAKVAPAHTALLLIDLQNDFCDENGMAGTARRDLSAVQAAAKRAADVLRAGRAAGVLVVFVKGIYSTPTNWYLSGPWLESDARRSGIPVDEARQVCALDSWGAELYGDLTPAADEPVVVKHRYSAFYNTELDSILRSHDVRTVVLSGVTSNVCVESTARDAFMRDYYVAFLSDGTGAYSQGEHESTLHNIDRYFGQVATVDAVISRWNDEPVS